MWSLRNAFVVSATALTIAAGASAVPGTAFAHGGGRGFHSNSHATVLAVAAYTLAIMTTAGEDVTTARA